MNVQEFRAMLEHPEKLPVTQYPELPLPEAGTWAQVEMPGRESEDFFLYFPFEPTEGSVTVEHDPVTGQFRWIFRDWKEFLLIGPNPDGGRMIPWETYSSPQWVKKVWRNPFGSGFGNVWLRRLRDQDDLVWVAPPAPRHIKLSDLRRIFDGPVIVDQD